MFKNKLRSTPKIFIVLLLFLLSKFTYSQDHINWSYNLSVYEVNIRQYTEEGTFAAFETHLERLKDLGIRILWFMPIHPIGVQNRLGSLGSYYSVKDYLDVNPEFGTLDDFKSLINKAHDMGFYVLIDWIANHTSWDNSLTISNPEWFTKDGNGNFMPPEGTNWSDVIDLDYNNTGLRDYMTNAMKFWITETDIDGFRCDAASWVPLDFWKTTITELKSIKPEILMLAESDGTEYKGVGFDMTYAWKLYGFGGGILPNIYSGAYTANNLATFLREELTLFSDGHYRLYFTSNHDENSWEGTVFERFGDAAENFAVLTLTLNSVPLIYSGQEAGLNKRLKFFDKDQIIWNSHSFANIYSKLLNLKMENKALWNGNNGGPAQRILTNNNPEIFSFISQKDGDKIFAIFNVTDKNQNVLPVGNLHNGTFVEIFTNDTITFSEQTEIIVSPWGYKVYNKIPEVTAIIENNKLPVEYSLEQNYPNPFNPTTTLSYSIPEQANVSLIIYDILGREVRTLVNEKKNKGTYEIKFDASSLPSGVYIYRFKSDNFLESKKLILLK